MTREDATLTREDAGLTSEDAGIDSQGCRNVRFKGTKELFELLKSSSCPLLLHFLRDTLLLPSASDYQYERQHMLLDAL